MNLEFGPEAPLLLHAVAAAALVGHIAGGTMGMLSGAVAMAAPKGGRLHQVAGTMFFISMLAMAGIAAVVAPMLDEDRWTNTTAAVFTLYLVATAWAAVRRPPGSVGRFECAAAVIPLGIAVLGLVLALAGRSIGGTEDFTTVYAFAGVCAAAFVADITVIRRRGLRGFPRAARHLWRMSAALFVATGSFFFGQADVLPEAVRASIVPTVLGLAPMALMAFWLIRVRMPGRLRLRVVEW